MTFDPVQIRYVQYGRSPSAEPTFRPTGKRYSPTRNFRVACEMADISPEDARSHNRSREVTLKRFHVMSIMRSWGRSLPAIGRLMNRDHTSILHGLRRWEAMKARDAGLSADLRAGVSE